MKCSCALLSVITLLLFSSHAPATEPQVANVRASQRPDTKLVDVYYDLAGSDAMVRVHVSTNSGLRYDLPVHAFRGDGYTDETLGGNKVPAGLYRHVTWDAGVDFRGQYSETVRLRVTAAKRPTPPPADMVLLQSTVAGPVSPGPFSHLGIGDVGDQTDRSPRVLVQHQPFYMSKHEATNQDVADAMQWGLENGHITKNTSSREVSHPVVGSPRTVLFKYGGAYPQIELSGVTLRAVPGKEFYPCVGINWYGALVYCNLKSMIDGLEPCYNLDAWTCDFTKTGYRLPTEAEWEAGARDDDDPDPVFPWISPATIDHSQANYYSTNTLSYDVSTTRGHHPTYSGGPEPFTCPVDTFSANPRGLLNMAGNAAEWCWDWYQSDYYHWASQFHQYAIANPLCYPTGPASAPTQTPQKVVRGGSWDDTADYCDSTMRHRVDPLACRSTIGFRTVRLPE